MTDPRPSNNPDGKPAQSPDGRNKVSVSAKIDPAVHDRFIAAAKGGLLNGNKSRIIEAALDAFLQGCES